MTSPKLPRLSDNDSENKAALLQYFASIYLAKKLSIESENIESEKRAASVNKIFSDAQIFLIENLDSMTDNTLDSTAKLSNILMIKYCSYVSMLQYRNYYRKYDYMSLSRRVGEIWEPFCKSCFDFPVNSDIVPADIGNFGKIKSDLKYSMATLLNKIEDEALKMEVSSKIDVLWGLVDSGEVSVALDCHIKEKATKYHIDFKSGFGSNEKGNTNRLLLVGRIYRDAIEGENRCILLVRQMENNNYFAKLKNSGLWEAYVGQSAYQLIKDITHFDISKWVKENVNFLEDIDDDTAKYFCDNKLDKYLIW